jgi:hypothetical protein
LPLLTLLTANKINETIFIQAFSLCCLNVFEATLVDLFFLFFLGKKGHKFTEVIQKVAEKKR